MTDASTSLDMSTGLRKVAERAKREPAARFHSLAHLIDEKLLAGMYQRLRGKAAVGVDGITKEQYGRDLQSNLRDLHERLRTRRYRHQPIRRVHIPKEKKGQTRPIGISTTEDKVVQSALREVLEVIYEQDFLECSYGFRPGRSAHDAVRALTRAVDEGEANWILEFDVVSFFDSVRRTQLLEMLQKRVADGSMLRLIGKCLHVGVLDGAEFTTPSEGTVQGSTLSPLLGNAYLHNALDLWFAEEVRPHLRGKGVLVRYADDGVFGFERQDDAQRVLAVLGKRLERFGLRLHPEKTRLLDFRRPLRSQGKGKSPTTFDFLGFCWYWRRTRKGNWSVTCKTRRARLARAIQAVYAWCRENRHQPVKQQHETLTRKVQGHINYFGVNGNMDSLERFLRQAHRSWFKWLNRRSQRARLTWDRYEDLLRDFPLPKCRIVVKIWR
jgi:group II intron reverse transcriptase/maturase